MFIYHVDELITLLGRFSAENVINDYIADYISSGRLTSELKKYFKDEYLDESIMSDVSNLYQLKLIQLDKGLMNKCLHQIKNDYDWNVSEEEFLQYLLVNKPVTLNIVYALNDFFTKYNERLVKDEKKIDSLIALDHINDQVNDKHYVENYLQKRALVILYINGTILSSSTKLHEDLLADYNKNYKQYKSQWIIDLTKIKMPIIWGSIVRNRIPCARLILHGGHVCECIICYSGDKFSIAQEVHKKFNCKVYSFFPGTHIVTRMAKKNNHK